MHAEVLSRDGSLTRVGQAAVLAIGVVVVVGAMHVAAVAIVPIVASLLLCGMLWPIRAWLARRMPAWLAAGLCTAILVVALALVVGWGWYAAEAAAEEFRSSREQYVEQYQKLRSWVTGLGIPEESVPTLGGEDGEGSANQSETLVSQETRNDIISIITGGLRSVLGIVAAVLLTVFLAYLALYEGERWASWGRKKLSENHYGVIARIVADSSSHTRWYFLAKTITGVVSGAATWLWLWAMGVPLALVWGVFTAFMNYIPNIGALISGVPPTVLAIVHLGWAEGLVVAAGLFVIETAVGNLLDPFVQGNMLSMSFFVTLASLVFWAWMWGIAGALLAPVLTAVIITVAVRVQEGRKASIDGVPLPGPG